MFYKSTLKSVFLPTWLLSTKNFEIFLKLVGRKKRKQTWQKNKILQKYLLTDGLKNGL